MTDIRHGLPAPAAGEDAFVTQEKPSAPVVDAAPLRGTPLLRARRWGLAGGESIVASVGIAAGAVLLGVLAASSWWTLHTHGASLDRSREDQVKVVGELLAVSAEALLAANETSGVRRLVAEAAVRYSLSECRVVLGDGAVVADADAGRPVSRPPAEWPATPGGEATVERTFGAVSVRVPLNVAGRGGAVLEVGAAVRHPVWAGSDVAAGVGAIGAAGMIGLLVTYRSTRTRLRGLAAVRDALRASASGETSAGALLVSERFGAEARAWNALLGERDALRARAAVEGAAEKLAARGSRDGDLAGACDALWTGLIILDDRARVRYANGAASVLLKAKREELVGADLSRFVEEAPVAEALAAVAAGRSRQRTSVELERQLPGGERAVLRFTARPMRREDAASAIVVVEDVTQQRVADESRNAFVASATHELRTPLTNIRLYVEMLTDEGEVDPAVRAKCINVIGTESRRLERIVTDMLSVSEIEAGSMRINPGDVRLDAVFEELAEDFAAQATQREIRLTFDLPPKMPVVQGDRDKLVLLLHNLVGNALKYTPAGGAVTVALREEAGNLRVDVTDNGIGIGEDEQELVFEKFYRAKDRRIAGIAGSGIGLALARQVARLHGGDITVKSQIDKGSTFSLSVPVGSQGATRAKAA